MQNLPILLILEYFFNWLFEQDCDFESQRQAWVVFAGFNGVNGLSGHAKFFSQGRLRPTDIGA